MQEHKENAGVQKRKMPERRCIGCGQHFPKSSLVRIVRTPDGTVKLDFVGKVSGRGAYLCPKASCLARLQKSKRAEKVLECPIPETVYQSIALALSEEDKA